MNLYQSDNKDFNCFAQLYKSGVANQYGNLITKASFHMLLARYVGITPLQTNADTNYSKTLYKIQTFICPKADLSKSAALNQYYLTYGANGTGSGKTTGKQRVFGLSTSKGMSGGSPKITQFRKPGRVLAITDRGESEAIGKSTNGTPWIRPGDKDGGSWTSFLALYTSIMLRHNGNANVLFLDSHVKPMKQDEFMNKTAEKDELWGTKDLLN